VAICGGGRKMIQLDIRRGLLKKLMEEKGWSKKRFALELQIDCSYLYRILKGERNPGGKFISAIFEFCKKNNLSFDDYVFIKVGKKPK
jgi:transcriptional regulator with XRE-family HTH domain